MAGGFSYDYAKPISSTEIFISGSWTTVGALPLKLTGLASASVGNNVIVAGENKVYTKKPF